MRISDWSSDVFSSDLGTIPDADLAPVIARRDIVERHVLFGMAALAVDARPVGVRHHRDAGVDDPADHRDMAEAELGRFGEHDHRADAGCVAALVAILGLAPPCPGVTVDLDTRGRARDPPALQRKSD